MDESDVELSILLAAALGAVLFATAAAVAAAFRRPSFHLLPSDLFFCWAGRAVDHLQAHLSLSSG